MTAEPHWLTKARSYIGTAEIAGARHNARIVGWWQRIKSIFRDDETPWCAAFVGGMLEECGIKSTKAASARSYLNWGTTLAEPLIGCVVVLWRGKPDGPYGHVGFVVGEDRFGNLMVLGGNQGDAVNIKPFPYSRVLAFQWPSGQGAMGFGGKLPLLTSNGNVSVNEA